MPTPFWVDPVTHKPVHPTLVLKNNRFSWSDSCHQCCHDPSSEDGSGAAGACSALAYLDGMYYSPEVRSIICTQHHHLMPRLELTSHVHKCHQFAFKMLQCSGITLPSILDHISTGFSPPPSDSFEDIVEVLKTTRLSKPLPGLPTPELSNQCPHCYRWFTSSDDYGRIKSLSKHFRTKTETYKTCREWFAKQTRKDLHLPSLPRIYTQPLFKDGSKMGYRARLPPDYTPDIPMIPSFTSTTSAPRTRPDKTIQSPYYLIESGWIPYVQSLNVEPETLIRLVAPPSLRARASWDEGTEGYKIKEGLLDFYDPYGHYLVDGNTRVNSCPDVVRHSLVAE